MQLRSHESAKKANKRHVIKRIPQCVREELLFNTEFTEFAVFTQVHTYRVVFPRTLSLTL